ncbi:RIP metalloprotease RseP [Pyxidicoccus parkwayensis]|uniref:RIP metalloprotease RseP n=1 Tax=Pyxidicoccus parkwayensis TaxID=2813578 RepID=A0ABX7PBZ6_9BACT|nr:RIP metalloprotease RseP [Pyxidicoccus parkwaysis]QSQ27900.1 RIP metalloprotease RseP [Pyxidicoccus parkwaysis]
MSQLQNAGFFIVLLGVLVTVHELGHFLVAKACGVKVLKFSIGFGPKLIGFTKGETEYQIALLPLGGFVKMAGDLPHEELSPEEASRGFLAQPPWKRGLIVLAGPAFNLIFPVLIYFFVYLGPHQATSTLVGSVTPNQPAAVAGIRPGDRVRSVDGVEVTTFTDMQEAFIGRFGRPIPVVVERDGQRLTLEVKPEKVVETSPIDTVERGQIGVGAASRPALVGVPKGSVAEQAGLRTFDRILTVNGTPVADEARLQQAVDKFQPGAPLELVVRRLDAVDAGAVTGRAPRVLKLTVPKQAGEGLVALGAEPADMFLAIVASGSAAEKAGLKPGDRLLSLDGDSLESFQELAQKLSILKDQPFTLVWRGADGEHKEKLAQAPLPMTDGMGTKSAPLALGVRGWMPTATDVPPQDEVTVHLGPAAAFKEAALVVPKIVFQMVKVIGGLFTKAVPLSTVGGPIMMYQMASKSAEQGLDSFLNLMAIISINLGVMNLLPIPVLDGFHLLSAAWEGVRRRPIPVRVREVANMVGLALLIMLMLLAVTNDVMR